MFFLVAFAFNLYKILQEVYNSDEYSKRKVKFYFYEPKLEVTHSNIELLLKFGEG